jgi:hypothetical protein
MDPAAMQGGGMPPPEEDPIEIIRSIVQEEIARSGAGQGGGEEESPTRVTNKKLDERLDRIEQMLSTVTEALGMAAPMVGPGEDSSMPPMEQGSPEELATIAGMQPKTASERKEPIGLKDILFRLERASR